MSPSPTRPRRASAPARRVASVAPRPEISSRAAWTVVIVVLIAVAAIRVRIAGIPLERDEGEYAYAGQLILQGVPPYALAYNMKFPGTYYAYAAVMAVLGQTTRAIHWGLLVVNAATILVVFLLGRRLLGQLAGAVGAIAFAVLSLDRWVAGPTAHATHFLLLPLMAGVLLMVRSWPNGSLLSIAGAGALMALAVVMKQQAAVFVILALVAMAWQARGQALQAGRARVWLALVAGLATPIVLLIAVLATQGVIGRFWYWTFGYAHEYVSEVPMSGAFDILPMAIGFITRATQPFWWLAAGGFLCLWVLEWKRDARLITVTLLAGGFAAACPGFYFRNHYFIPMLPALGLLAGVAIDGVARGLARFMAATSAAAVAGLVFLAIVGVYGADEQAYLFTTNPDALSKEISGANPFVESEQIAAYLAAHTKPTRRLACSARNRRSFSRRNADRRPAICTPIRDGAAALRAGDAEEFIQQIQSGASSLSGCRPCESLVAAPPGIRSADYELDADDTPTACYDRLMGGDISGTADLDLHWDADALAFQPRTTSQIYVLRRKSTELCAAK